MADLGPERPIKPEAHEAYLLGRYFGYAGEVEKSRGSFQKAIDLQPDYAAAWSGLADVYGGSAAGGMARPQATMPKALDAAAKAVELDDSSAEAHSSVAALAIFYKWNWQEADRESARAVELDPNRGECHHIRAYALTALNRLGEALQEERRAAELEPLLRPWAVGKALIRARRFDEALQELRLRSEAQPNDGDVHLQLATVYGYKGMETESEQEWEILLADDKEKSAAAQEAFRRGGSQARDEWYLNDLIQQSAHKYVSPFDFAKIHAQLRHKSETLHYLEESYRERAPWLVHVQHNPEFDFVHGEPRYRAIIAKMGLPPA